MNSPVLDYHRTQISFRANRLIALQSALALAATFWGIQIFAGHGMGTIGEFLMWGSESFLFRPVVVAYSGFACLAICVCLPWRYTHAVLGLVGGTFLTLALVWMLWQSDMPVSSLPSATPFIVVDTMWFAQMLYLAFRGKPLA